MEKMTELEKRIAELEEKLENVMVYFEGAEVNFKNSTINLLQILGDGANMALENVPLDSVEISGDGNNVGFSNCPIASCTNGVETDLDDREARADDLECRIADIKCAALDAKTILDEVQTHFDKLSGEIEGLKSESQGIKMREPFQVLAVPYRFIENERCFCVFRRADSDIWQFIAGGGESNEKPMDAALREIKEETGVTAKQLTALQSVAFVPAEVVAENLRAHWDKNTFVIPEYSFAFECTADPTLSREHSECKWLPYDEARKLLKWDSNKVAMYEMMCRLRNYE